MIKCQEVTMIISIGINSKEGQKARSRNVMKSRWLKRRSVPSNLSSHGEWEVITFKIDSGAVDNVIPMSVGQEFPIKPTNLSTMGVNHQAANGSPIKNHSQRNIRGFTSEWLPMTMASQVADVNRPLSSVHHIVKSGNTAIC